MKAFFHISIISYTKCNINSTPSGFFFFTAHNMRLPISVMDIINLPMDEFNDLLSKHELTEEQLTMCRDIRRRGKNKVIFMYIYYKRRLIV